MNARVRRIIGFVLAALFFLILLGVTYQGVATAFERRRLAHPGGMVKAGRHQLHLHCTGDGAPTVVLEAPATAMSAAWGWVQSRVADDTRVCSYDRAGLGWSEWGELEFDPVAVPVQLHTLLLNAREQQPFVLVGHGLGADLAKLTAARYPQDVAALLVIDPPATIDDQQLGQLARSSAMAPWLARIGVLRVTRALRGEAIGLPEPYASRLRTFLMRPDHLTRSARELAGWNATVTLAAGISLPPDLPTTTLMLAGPSPAAMLTRQADGARTAREILRLVSDVRQREGRGGEADAPAPTGTTERAPAP